jgi:tetratricopeptide (TPR) repeat protein
MLLQRYINTAMRLLLPVTILLVAGCASSGPELADSRQSESATAVRSDAGQVLPEIPRQALTMFEQAVSIMASGDFVDAELRLKEFLLLYPAYPGAYVNLAIIHSQNGNDQAAQESVDRALALDPVHAAALNQQGMLLRRNGKFLEAEAAYLKAVTSSPDYALAHYNLGILNELYLQRLDVALQHFEAYQQIVGSDKQVGKWIADLTRRVAANQRTANVAE